MNKIIRTICLFRKKIGDDDINHLINLKAKFEQHGFVVQTIRICSPTLSFTELERTVPNQDILLSVGTLDIKEAIDKLSDFYKSERTSFNVELAKKRLNLKHTNILFNIINSAPANTFNFTYTFNNAFSSPYFPSAAYKQDGFAIGLQPTNLTASVKILEDWFDLMKQVWEEINKIAKVEDGYLGIDSSIAPLFEGESSLIHFIKKIGISFNDSVLSNTYLKITHYIKNNNPKPIGLNGLMLPALEDFELANEYEQGNFSIERNVFLSLHSGLGIDTYPIGINESPQKVLNILKMMQDLSNKYNKPLSVRFISDGKAKVGELTDFKNQYLKNVVVRKL